jgi:asparagine synthase (glutamine-hydrolysing)
MRAGSLPRLSIELGLTAVMATQLWHHLFISGNLAELPTFQGFVPPSEKRINK